MPFKKRKLSRQVFGRFVGDFGPFDGTFGLPASPESYNLGLFEGLNYKKRPFQVDLVGETPVISGDSNDILLANAEFSTTFKVNKGYFIDAFRLGLNPRTLAAVSVRENGDLVVIKGGAKSVLTNYLETAVEAKIGNSPMVETKEENGPLISLSFEFVNGSLINFGSPQNAPVLWFEVKHQNKETVPVDQFALISSVSIYSVEQLAAKYGLTGWAPGLGLDEEQFASTTYFRCFSAESFGFQFALGKTYLQNRAVFGQPLPPGWDANLPTTEYGYFNPQNAFNILYNPVVGIAGTEL